MWIADGWKDYEVLDTSGGEKLERWGDYLLVRPDPQVIWNTKKENPGWKKKNGHYHRSSKGGGEWEFFNLPEEWSIHYRELTFRLKPFSFKHTGLFPEQAANWDWFGEKIQKAGRPIKSCFNIYNTSIRISQVIEKCRFRLGCLDRQDLTVCFHRGDLGICCRTIVHSKQVFQTLLDCLRIHIPSAGKFYIVL